VYLKKNTKRRISGKIEKGCSGENVRWSCGMNDASRGKKKRKKEKKKKPNKKRRVVSVSPFATTEDGADIRLGGGVALAVPGEGL